jgi:hypothetical protein
MKEKIISKIPVTTVFLLIFLSQSCVNNSEEELYGVKPCDLINITWQAKIADIMAKNCVMCHGPDIHYNGVRHDTYAYEMIVVNDGRLRGVVNHLEGFSKMPKNKAMLPDCELKLINTWLDNGAPEF